MTPPISTEGGCSSTGYKGRCAAVEPNVLLCPTTVVKKLGKQGTTDPTSPITATLRIRRRQVGGRTGICRAQGGQGCGGKAEHRSVPELLCISIVTAFRAALLIRSASKERWYKDRASDRSAYCKFCFLMSLVLLFL